jgi:hypothetical protein
VLDQPVIVGVRPDAARSYGSVRRLKIFGTRKLTNGSAQMRSVPCTRCSVVVGQTGQLLVVIDVQERLPRALLDLPGEVGDEIVAVQNEGHGSIRDVIVDRLQRCDACDTRCTEGDVPEGSAG